MGDIQIVPLVIAASALVGGGCALKAAIAGFLSYMQKRLYYSAPVTQGKRVMKLARSHGLPPDQSFSVGMTHTDALTARDVQAPSEAPVTDPGLDPLATTERFAAIVAQLKQPPNPPGSPP